MQFTRQTVGRFFSTKMSKTIHVLSQIPKLSEMTAEAMPDCHVIDVRLRQKKSEEMDMKLKLGEEEINDLKEAVIVFGDPNLLPQTFHRLPRVQWYQTTWAGIDFINTHLAETGTRPPECPVTRFTGGSFGQSIFDYCVAHLIMTERKLFDDYKNCTLGKKWNKQLLWDYKSTNEMTVAILGGTGAIGSFVADKFRQLGATVVGYGRKARSELSDGDLPLDLYSNKLEDILPKCDCLISILPDTPDSRGLLNNGVLSQCAERSPVFINVGRGTVIAESEIITALDNKWISTAILDVFEVEPLPESSPLWSHPEVVITPHIAAISRARDCVKLLVEQHKRFLNNEPLLYSVDWQSGY